MVLIVRDRATSRVLNTPEFDIGQLGLIGRIRLFIARRRADAMLRRVLRPYRRGSAAPLSQHLLKDIGLPPDFRM
jgi:uncharacterized protein YjiS (DUF1127 family)